MVFSILTDQNRLLLWRWVRFSVFRLQIFFEVLERARTGFISSDNVPVNFSIGLEVVNGTNTTCEGQENPHSFTFCPFTNNMWRLCPGPYSPNNTLDMTFSLQTVRNLFLKENERYEDNMIAWLSFVHGNVVPIFEYMLGYIPVREYEEGKISNFTLKIDKLDCNPLLTLTKCVLSELFSWVSQPTHTTKLF